jgi:peptidoglycan/LPS O-acetylase OafA/YrhL
MQPSAKTAASTVFRFRHLPQLDGFRGLAVLMVVVGHWFHYGIRKGILQGLGIVLEDLGVFLFFVLSGFLITSLLLRERTDSGGISLRKFYIRRALRLGPALLLFLAAVVMLMSVRAIIDIPRYEVVASLFYGRNFFGKSNSLAHLWSLSLEEQFYLCWPLLFSVLPLRRSFSTIAVITGVIAIWRGVAMHFHLLESNAGVYYMRPYFRFDSILIGACLALAVVSNEKYFEWVRTAARNIPAVLLWVLLLTWSAMVSLSNPVYLTVQSIVIVMLLAQIIAGASASSVALFEWPVLTYLGKISYSLYLWQQLFLVTKEPSWGALRQFPMNLAIPLALSVVSFHFIEAPALRLKERF